MECAPVKRHFLGYFYPLFLLSGNESVFLIYQRGYRKHLKNHCARRRNSSIYNAVMVYRNLYGNCAYLGVRLFIGTGYQEEEIETNLLDYIENSLPRTEKLLRLSLWKMPEVLENGRGPQIEQGILEAAAADSRYSHLLSKEEERDCKRCCERISNLIIPNEFARQAKEKTDGMDLGTQSGNKESKEKKKLEIE